MPPITPTPDQFPSSIYGIHDPEAATFLGQNNAAGWLVHSVKVWDDPPGDYTATVNAGHRVLVRLNNGYGGDGTLPLPGQYDAFAQKCAEWVGASRGARCWIIGNEMNASFERPQGQPIFPNQYASCFDKCRNRIHAVAGHANDQVIVGAVAPYNIDTTYTGNAGGDWVKYFKDVLAALGDRVDGISIHCYSRGQHPGAVTDPATFSPPYNANHQGFLAYQDFVQAIPANLRQLPIYITETQPIIGDAPNWLNENGGWVRAAFEEINRWNTTAGRQPIQALCLFRWLNTDPNWCFSTRPNVLNDFREAIARRYALKLPGIITPVPGQTLEQAVLQKARTVPWMPVNNTAALWKWAKAHGLQDQQTDELALSFNGEQYIVQVFNLGIVYVKVGDWGNVKVIPK
jgi:hypothetical protein